jgi:radical SAM protein with 4Fe4S-binding SPASM domain
MDVFQNPRVGIATSFQYGSGRLKGDYSVFTEEDFWNCSNAVLEHCGYRPSFIAVITEENEDSVIRTVELAKKMDVVCKVNYAMASGEQDKPYMLAKIYYQYVKIWQAGLAEWEHNTQQMMNRLRGEATICPLTRTCDSHIRTIQPEGDYYSCGAFGDDKEKAIDWDFEMNGGFATPLADSFELNSLKKGCYTCPMFQICNGCKKTIKDLKKHNMVEEHCYNMKLLGPAILASNDMEGIQMTPYENESAQFKIL